MAALFDQLFVIVDGLDECGDGTNDVVEALLSLGHNSDSLSLALLSRSEPEIRDKLRGVSSEIEISARSSDVKEYISAEIEDRIRTKRLRIKDVQLKGDILASLVDGRSRNVS